MPEQLRIDGTICLGPTLSGLLLIIMTLLGQRSLPIVQQVAAMLARLPISLAYQWSRSGSSRTPRSATATRRRPSEPARPPRRPRGRSSSGAVGIVRVALVVGLLVILVATMAPSLSHRCVSEADLWQLSGRTSVVDDADFQDFRFSEQNLNPVSHVWGDAFHGNLIAGHVKAELSAEGEEQHFLRCPFRCGETGGGWPPSVAVRGKAEQAFSAIPRYGAIIVQLRIPTESDVPQVPKYYSLRVRDRRGTYWKYACHKSSYWQFDVPADGQWHTRRIDLRDATQWEVFLPDGNAAFPGEQPDFSIITDVVFEIGDRGGDRPVPSTGTIDIGPITLD